MFWRDPIYRPSRFREKHADDRRGNRYMLHDHEADPRMSRISQFEQDVVRAQVDALPAGAVVVDVPCGNGRMSQWVARRPELQLVAMDYNVQMLHGMRHREPASMLPRRVQADVLQLPLPDRSVDLVINMRLMHHIADRPTQVAMMRELARVCRGTVVTSFWTTRSWRYVRRRMLGKPIRCFPIPPDAFCGVCEEAGLDVERMLPVRRWIEEQTLVIARVRNHD